MGVVVLFTLTQLGQSGMKGEVMGVVVLFTLTLLRQSGMKGEVMGGGYWLGEVVPTEMENYPRCIWDDRTSQGRITHDASL